MRMRLGLLQDPAVIERQIQREIAEAEAKRKKVAQTPTVKTEAETKAEEAQRAKDKEHAAEKIKKPPKIRPLSEARAIESGANFISEAFMFLVAGSVIVFESWRSRRKESSRREDVAERLEILEARIGELTAELEIEKGQLIKQTPTEVPKEEQDSKQPKPVGGERKTEPSREKTKSPSTTPSETSFLTRLGYKRS